jgi:site-specific DNA-methyltransferase (adenine-specific)
MKQIVINGDNIALLNNYPDNYFDAIVTDPPYGLGKEPNAEEVMKGWIEKGYHEVGGSGFMGKEWDAFIPQPIFWKEVFRVLKHGGHVLSFFGSRTYDWGVMSMRFAEFEVRDTITWHFGSGFPKSHNISKSIDKLHGAEREIIGKNENHRERNNPMAEMLNLSNGDITAPSTDAAKQWEGWGSALKPASEYIVLARKPIEKGLSIAENVLKWGTGGINIDGCRIGLSKGDDSRLGGNGTWKTDKLASSIYEGGYEGKDIASSTQGRFPANLILQHSTMCQLNGLKKVKSGISSDKGGGFGKGQIYGSEKTNGISDNIGGGYGDETIEDWNCVQDCPIRIMDEQSGILKSGKLIGEYNGFGNNGIYGKSGTSNRNYESDSGGASRFFKQVNYSKKEIHYCYLCDKANKNELWKNNYNNVLNAVSNLKSTSQMKEPIVQENVTESLKLKADQLVRSVANSCDLCVTNFVQEVVEISNLDSNQEISQVMRDFIQSYKKCTLLQSLVCYVEMMDNIDTTPTTKNLLKLFGSALIAIENYTKKDIKGKEEQKSEQTRFLYQPKANKSERNKGLKGFEEKEKPDNYIMPKLTCSECGSKRVDSSNSLVCGCNGKTHYEQQNSVESKNNLAGGNRNIHPTVKPVKLMQYLVRLITPPNGKVLDPFCGSGTTGIACKLEGFEFVGLEQDAEYCKIAQSRIDNYQEEIEEIVYITNKEGEKKQIIQTSLF